MRLIINADDCGYSKTNNSHIKQAIEKGKITSTTIMANMPEVEEAICLYETYRTDISFGIHLNLTEGEPLINSQTLVDFGYYAFNEGRACFNFDNAEQFRYKRLPKAVKDAIYRELAAQITKLKNMGIELSHIDSHQHIHTCASLMGVIAQLSKDFNLPKVRRIKNYVSPHSMSFWGRQAWYILSKTHNRHYIMANYFSSFQDFFNNPALLSLKDKDSLELMVHPGHYQEAYQEEEQMMLDTNYPSNIHLINYKEL